MTTVEPTGRWDDELAFDEPDVSSSGTLLRFLGREIDPLSLAQELKYGAADSTAVKEVLDTAFVADKTKALVNQKTRDRAGWQTVPPRSVALPSMGPGHASSSCEPPGRPSANFTRSLPLARANRDVRAVAPPTRRGPV